MGRRQRHRSSKSVRKRAYLSQEGSCFYCGKETPFEDWTIDHKNPVSRGGSNRFDNKIGCCYNCNKAKGNMTMAEFLETSFLPDSRRRIFGYRYSPTVPYKTAKRRQNQRLRMMIKPPIWERIKKYFTLLTNKKSLIH